MDGQGGTYQRWGERKLAHIDAQLRNLHSELSQASMEEPQQREQLLREIDECYKSRDRCIHRTLELEELRASGHRQAAGSTTSAHARPFRYSLSSEGEPEAVFSLVRSSSPIAQRLRRHSLDVRACARELGTRRAGLTPAPSPPPRHSTQGFPIRGQAESKLPASAAGRLAGTSAGDAVLRRTWDGSMLRTPLAVGSHSFHDIDHRLSDLEDLILEVTAAGDLKGRSMVNSLTTAAFASPQAWGGDSVDEDAWDQLPAGRLVPGDALASRQQHIAPQPEPRAPASSRGRKAPVDTAGAGTSYFRRGPPSQASRGITEQKGAGARPRGLRPAPKAQPGRSRSPEPRHGPRARPASRGGAGGGGPTASHHTHARGEGRAPLARPLGHEEAPLARTPAQAGSSPTRTRAVVGATFKPTAPAKPGGERRSRLESRRHTGMATGPKVAVPLVEKAPSDRQALAEGADETIQSPSPTVSFHPSAALPAAQPPKKTARQSRLQQRRATGLGPSQRPPVLITTRGGQKVPAGRGAKGRAVAAAVPQDAVGTCTPRGDAVASAGDAPLPSSVAIAAAIAVRSPDRERRPQSAGRAPRPSRPSFAAEVGSVSASGPARAPPPRTTRPQEGGRKSPPPSRIPRRGLSRTKPHDLAQVMPTASAY